MTGFEAALHLRLLRHFESVVDLDPKAADCAFQLGVSERQVDRSKILRATVDRRGFGAPQRAACQVSNYSTLLNTSECIV
jgi:hypothetical protein